MLEKKFHQVRPLYYTDYSFLTRCKVYIEEFLSQEGAIPV